MCRSWLLMIYSPEETSFVAVAEQGLGWALYTVLSCDGDHLLTGPSVTHKKRKQNQNTVGLTNFNCCELSQSNDLAPQYLTSKFTKRSNIHTRNTRTRNSLQIPLYKTAIGQRTFSYRGANTWNNLHNELRQSASLASFKRALKETLLRQTFPS